HLSLRRRNFQKVVYKGMPLMATPNPARFTPIIAGGSSTVMTCPDAYVNLDSKIPAQINLLQGKIAGQLNPNLAIGLANAAIPGQITSAYQRNQISSAALTAADLIRQNALLNTLADTSQITGQKINDPASMVLAVGRSQAVAQTNASWMNYAKVAEEALPMIRNAIEAICYALFPFVFLLLFLTSGKQTMMALKSYLVTLIWIQLWPPIYAILNYMGSLATASQLSASADIGGGGKALAIQTASSIYSGAISTEAVVGYLVLAIPAIAWAAIKGMETIGQAAITGVGSIQSAVTGSTSSASVGNTSLGNVTMDQVRQDPNRTSAFQNTWQDDKTGNIFSQNISSGIRAVKMLKNESFLSHGVGAGVTAGSEERASKAMQIAQSELVSANQEMAASLTEGVLKGRDKLNTSRLGSGYSRAEVADMQNNVQQVRGIISELSKRTGKSEEQVAGLLFSGGGSVGGDMSIAGGKGSGSGGSGVRAGGSVSGGVNLGGKLSQSYTSGVGRDYADVARNLTQEQATQLQTYAKRYQRDENFVHALATGQRDAEDKSARLAQSSSRVQRAEASMTAAQRFAEELKLSHSQDDRINADVWSDPRNTDALLDFVERYDGSPRMAAVAANNYLAEKGVLSHPTSYSDGAIAEWGFGALKDQFDEAKNEARYSPNIEDAYSGLKRTVGANMSGSNGAGNLSTQTEAAINKVSSEAASSWEKAQTTKANADRNFKKVSGIIDNPPDLPDQKGVGNPDGALTTKRILANDVTDTLVRDAKQSMETTSEGIKELAEKGKGVYESVEKEVVTAGKAGIDKAKSLLK
ncbi:MAG: conjugal transfer protein TraG N-terminal domain-containing protein, partial [Pseudomonadota bacterium]